jgi:hypothetical protein
MLFICSIFMFFYYVYDIKNKKAIRIDTSHILNKMDSS